MKPENIGLIVFGILLLFIGLIASFYPQIKTYTGYKYDYFTGEAHEYTEEISRTYPYQGIGILLSLAGIALTTVGLVVTRAS